MVIKNLKCLVFAICLLSACTKNTDTYLHSKYFTNNSSDPVQFSITEETDNLPSVAQAVSQAVVAVQNENTTGFLVLCVADDSPCEKVGIESGDIIKSFNGVEIKNALSLQQQLYKTDANSYISLKFDRNGVTHNVVLKTVVNPVHTTFYNNEIN